MFRDKPRAYLALPFKRSSQLYQQIGVYRPDEVGTVRRYIELWLRDVLARPST